MIKAALHVHSTYSDGEFTLAELREKFLAAGCGVICMADHADTFDEAKVREYVREMESLSDARLAFVPGLEFGCVQRMHIVGYGVTTLVDSDDPQTVIAHIRAHGGVPVIAHPPDHLFEMIEGFAVLPDGIEGWNSKYDGRYAPRPGTFALIQRLQARSPSLKAFYGQDLHWRKQFAGLFNRLDIPLGDRGSVLRALARGEYEGVYEGKAGEVTLPSDARLPEPLVREFARSSERTMRFRSSVKSVKKALGGAFKLLPAPVKAQLRRFF